MDTNEKYFYECKYVPKGKHGSVRSSDIRLKKAVEQAEMQAVELEVVINHINCLFKKLKMDTIENPKLAILKDTFNHNKLKIDYNKIKTDNKLSDKRDIVWLKFTEDGYLGVVATSSDINYDYPRTKDDYNIKRNNGKWLHNTSGIIVHHLNKVWDDTFVLVFPLKNMPCGKVRGDIESAIGNYLIANNVPILDFYSHNY